MPREINNVVSYLPVTPVHGYVWPAHGFGHPPEAWDVSHEVLIGERPTWFHDWWWDCARWTLDGGIYIPWASSDLLTAGGALTELGAAWRQ